MSSASDRAYAYAKDRILDGRFEGGELISEGDVAGPTGLSRTPVREAFLRLESEGLLRLYPKRGALVVPVSAGEVEDVVETRQVVETFAIEKLIESGEGAAVGPELAAVVEQQRGLVAAHDAHGFVESDRAFHRILVAAAGNPFLLELHDSLRDRQARMWVTAIAREEGRMETIVAEHAELAAAVEAGDRERALALIAAHLEGTRRALRGGGEPPV